MSYSAELSPKLEARISEEIEILSSLGKGETLHIVGDPAVVAKKRYALYSWFHASGLKNRFKVATISPGLIIVSKKEIPESSGETTKVFRAPANLDEWLMEHIEALVGVEEEKARVFIEERLPPNLVGEALARWKGKLK